MDKSNYPSVCVPSKFQASAPNSKAMLKEPSPLYGVADQKQRNSNSMCAPSMYQNTKLSCCEAYSWVVALRQVSTLNRLTEVADSTSHSILHIAQQGLFEGRLGHRCICKRAN